MCTLNVWVYPNRFNKYEKSDVKHIAPQNFMGRNVTSLTVHPCFSQEFVARGNSVTV